MYSAFSSNVVESWRRNLNGKAMLFPEPSLRLSEGGAFTAFELFPALANGG